MNDVRLEPEQAPARAELLLAAEFGEDAPGRPIYAAHRHDADEPATATILTSAHDIRITVAFSAGRHLHSPRYRSRRAQSSPYSVRTPS